MVPANAGFFPQMTMIHAHLRNCAWSTTFQPLTAKGAAMAQTINNEDHHSDLSTTQARQAVTLGRMRYVLGISLTLVVIAFLAIWLSFSWPS